MTEKRGQDDEIVTTEPQLHNLSGEPAPGEDDPDLDFENVSPLRVGGEPDPDELLS